MGPRWPEDSPRRPKMGGKPQLASRRPLRVPVRLERALGNPPGGRDPPPSRGLGAISRGRPRSARHEIAKPGDPALPRQPSNGSSSRLLGRPLGGVERG
eukprot:1920006-Pyramimonas_sp.AAC.1